MVRENTALLMMMVGEKMLRGGMPGDGSITAWFPDTMNSGKMTEKTQPAMTWLLGRLVTTARGRPKPRKYGQLVST